MTELYSYKGAYPFPLPEDMTGYDIKDFTLAPKYPTMASDERLWWTGTDWLVEPANQADLDIQWAIVRESRDRLLSQSDVYVVRAYEKGDTVPQETVDYRQALRDVSKQTNPFSIVWPTAPAKPF